MRRIIAALAAAGACATLSACGGGSSSSAAQPAPATATVTVSATPSAAAAAQSATPSPASSSPTTLSPGLAKIEYVKALQRRFPVSFGSLRLNKLVSVGNAACGAFDRGVGFARVVRAGATIYPAVEAEFFTRQAITYLCPRHSDLLPPA